MYQVKDDENIEHGKFVIAIEHGKRHVSWRDEFIKRHSEGEAEAIMANTPFSEVLVVGLAS